MNVKELAERILREIEDGTLDPQAIVVRPFCMCDEEYGFVEAQHLDEVVRRYEVAHDPTEPIGMQEESIALRIYKYGNVEPGPPTVKTLKLG